MDKTILVLDEHEMDPSTETSERSVYKVRSAVRAVLTDLNGRVGLMHGFKDKYYKLPGGGVDEGESLLDALARELKEETGYRASVKTELGTVLEWRDFSHLKQISYAYEATTQGEPVKPSLTESELDEGFVFEWIDSIDEAIEKVEYSTNHASKGISFMSQRDTAILRAAKSS